MTRVESLGADRLLYGSLGGHFQDQKAVAKIPSTVSLPLRTGESHVFAVAREDLRFFDKTTGLRTEPRPL